MRTILHMVLKIIVLCNTLCWGFISEAMDHPRSRSGSPAHSQSLSLQPQKKILLWKNKDLKESGIQPSNVTPASLIITPDEDGVLFTHPGKVLYCSKKIMTDQYPYEIIHHSHAKFFPLIAVASQKDDESKKKMLIVASVLNNRSRKSKIPKIEVIVARLLAKNPPYLSHNVFDKHVIEYIDVNMQNEGMAHQQEFSLSNIQAVKIHKGGKLLTLGFGDHLRMIDLESKIVNKSYFMPRIVLNSRVVDVSTPVDSSSPHVPQQYVAAVNSEGIVDLKRYSQEYDYPLFSSIKSVDTCSLVENIGMTSTHDLLCVVPPGEVKIINVRDWLEHSDGCVKNRIISHSKGNMVAIDEEAQCSSVHWGDNRELPYENHSTMSVYRENGTSMNEISIAVPDLPKTYVFINEKGQEVEAASRILLATLRGDCVVAVTTEGYLYFWQLPEKHKAPTEENVRSGSQRSELTRRRSLSSPAEDLSKKYTHYAQTAPDKIFNDKRKSAKRSDNVPKLNIFKTSKESLVRGATRDTRESASPSGSPRKATSKDKTARVRKSMPPAYEKSTDLQPIDELKKLNVGQQDIINDFNRSKEMDS